MKAKSTAQGSKEASSSEAQKSNFAPRKFVAPQKESAVQRRQADKSPESVAASPNELFDEYLVERQKSREPQRSWASPPPALQRKAQPAPGAEAEASSDSGGERANQTGIPTPVLNTMEGVFDRDFSNVRVHAESPKAPAVQALAYTQGRDIHMAPGQYKPHTSEGKQLLGHELTHVVQQSEGRVQPTGTVAGVAINDSPGLEREANVMGSKAARASAPSSSAASVQRAAIEPGTLQRAARDRTLQNSSSTPPIQRVSGTIKFDDGTWKLTIEDTDYDIANRLRLDEMKKAGRDITGETREVRATVYGGKKMIKYTDEDNAFMEAQRTTDEKDDSVNFDDVQFFRNFPAAVQVPGEVSAPVASLATRDGAEVSLRIVRMFIYLNQVADVLQTNLGQLGADTAGGELTAKSLKALEDKLAAKTHEPKWNIIELARVNDLAGNPQALIGYLRQGYNTMVIFLGMHTTAKAKVNYLAERFGGDESYIRHVISAQKLAAIELGTAGWVEDWLDSYANTMPQDPTSRMQTEPKTNVAFLREWNQRDNRDTVAAVIQGVVQKFWAQEAKNMPMFDTFMIYLGLPAIETAFYHKGFDGRAIAAMVRAGR